MGSAASSAVKPPAERTRGTDEVVVVSARTSRSRTLTPEQVQEVLGAATAAPSSHNTQPWRFGVDGATIRLHADRSRSLPVNDPADRELTISCGAALLNLRVGLAACGVPARVQLLPGAEDLLATVEVGTGSAGTELAALAPAVGVRRTHRGHFDAEPLPDDLRAGLGQASAAEGAELTFLDDGARGEVAQLVAEGDRRQFADREWRRELASWMHRGRAGDGLVVPTLALPVTRLVVKTVDMGRRTGARDAALVLEASEVAVLTTPGDDPADWLRAGQALQRCLLVAALDGWSAGFANQPCQVGGELRAEAARHVSPGHPQVIMRLGRPAKPPARTPRRPLSAVLTAGSHR
jgi:hypothetical protein